MKLALILVPLTASPSLAQETYLYASKPNQGAAPLLVGTYELDGGGVLAGPAIDVAPSLPGNFLPTGIEWIGQEVWLASGNGVDRFVGSSLSPVGTSLAGEPVLALAPSTNGAFAFTATEIVELDVTGAELSRRSFGPITDAVAYQGGFAIIDGTPGSNRIETYDAQLAFTGEIGSGLEALANSSGTGLFPETLHPLRSGGLAVGGVVAIGLLDAAGVPVAVYNPGVFELAVVEAPDGSLFVPAQIRTSVIDAANGAQVESLHGFSRGVFSATSRDLGGLPTVERACTSSANSTGRPARAFAVGESSLAESVLAIGALDLPPDQFGLFAFGTAQGTAPFGNGTLCIQPNSGQVRRSPLFVTRPEGSIEIWLNFQTPPLGGSITAGSTWIFQALFRDPVGGGAGFNSSDAVAVTFRN